MLKFYKHVCYKILALSDLILHQAAYRCVCVARILVVLHVLCMVARRRAEAREDKKLARFFFFFFTQEQSFIMDARCASQLKLLLRNVDRKAL